MNPLTNMKNVQKLSERDLNSRSKTSWHDEYSHSAWIFVGGIPYELSEGDIITCFSQYGEIVNINLVRDKTTGKSKGYCFICYLDQRSTILAVDNFNGIKILGKIIRVDHVKDYKVPKELPDKEHDKDDFYNYPMKNEYKTKIKIERDDRSVDENKKHVRKRNDERKEVADGKRHAHKKGKKHRSKSSLVKRKKTAGSSSNDKSSSGKKLSNSRVNAKGRSSKSTKHAKKLAGNAGSRKLKSKAKKHDSSGDSGDSSSSDESSSGDSSSSGGSSSSNSATSSSGSSNESSSGSSGSSSDEGNSSSSDSSSGSDSSGSSSSSDSSASSSGSDSDSSSNGKRSRSGKRKRRGKKSVSAAAKGKQLGKKKRKLTDDNKTRSTEQGDAAPTTTSRDNNKKRSDAKKKETTVSRNHEATMKERDFDGNNDKVNGTKRNGRKRTNDEQRNPDSIRDSTRREEHDSTAGRGIRYRGEKTRSDSRGKRRSAGDSDRTDKRRRD